MASQIVIQGHVLEVLSEFGEGFFDCVITSPPYWGLRDYGLKPLIWDGDGNEDCEHEWGVDIDGAGKNNDQTAGEKQRTVHGSVDRDNRPSSQFCTLCGAWRGSLGLEPTPQLYIQHLMQIFDEIKRVLKPTGTCWVVIGDTHASGKGTCFNPGGGKNSLETKKKEEHGVYPLNRGNKSVLDKMGVKQKSLCQIPSRLSIAMTDAGWILRNEIIWHKRNCMPSSAKDRFTVDFEKVFFFTKSKRYWFEQQFDASNMARPQQRLRPNGLTVHCGALGYSTSCDSDGEKRNKRCVWDITAYYEMMIEEIISTEGDADVKARMITKLLSKQANTTWDVTTKSFKGAHFAVFPPKLVEPMLSAGCPEFVCTKCGKARTKIIRRTPSTSKMCPKTQDSHNARGGIGQPSGTVGKSGSGRINGIIEEIGLTDCECGAGFDGGWVLDPFAGAGTVGVVCKGQEKGFIGIELNSEYCTMANKRIESTSRKGKELPME